MQAINQEQLKDAKTAHEIKQTGQPLVVLKGTEGPNPTFIRKSRHDRGVKAVESRKIREELSEKYKTIMQNHIKQQMKNLLKEKIDLIQYNMVRFIKLPIILIVKYMQEAHVIY